MGPNERITNRDGLVGWAVEAARHLVRGVIPENPDGVTFDPRERVLPNFDTDSYIVSINGHERRFDGPPSHQELSSWIEERWRILLRSSLYLCCWADPSDGSFVLDVSRSNRGLEQAVRCGLDHEQNVIFHLASCKNIYIEEAARGLGIQLVVPNDVGDRHSELGRRELNLGCKCEEETVVIGGCHAGRGSGTLR